MKIKVSQRISHLPFRATSNLTNVQLKNDTLWADGVGTP
jgi:hypothetical protein